MIIIFSSIIVIYFFHSKIKFDTQIKKKNYDINFDYLNFESNITTKKMTKYSEGQLTINEAFFLNGLLRKIKAKNCLEIGVSTGGSAF